MSNPRSTPDSALVTAVIRWFDVHERPLPWRDSTPWGVLVSEFMLQQTPVDRVLPAWHRWMDRWPTPPALAEASVADALRAWDRLGYPRRAKWLHESAVVLTRRYDGEVPADPEALRELPGVGEYTASAVMAFAFGRRSVVLDTNVRRVLARSVFGTAAPPGHISAAERARLQELWPTAHRRSARWSAAVMELGALVCTARRPDCEACPIRDACAWLRAGQPPAADGTRRQAAYEGSDRQVRGRVMAVLRESVGPVPSDVVDGAWPDAEQRERAVAALLADGLVVRTPGGHLALPGGR